MDEQRTAGLIRTELYSRDAAAKHLGIEIIKLGPKYSRLSMRVTANLINFIGTVHGGYIFTLADTAFGYACTANNQRTIAHSCSITFTSPGKEGEILIAEASEVHKSGRTSLYDVKVSGDLDRTVALFRGTAHILGGKIIDALDQTLDRKQQHDE